MDDKTILLTWLGQAGFLLEGCGLKIVIDPYLSDSLHEKYKDGRFPHRRMMPVPVEPETLTDVSYVLCTHGHTDHMDPGTLPLLAGANPGCRFICPLAERKKALERGIPGKAFTGVDAGMEKELAGRLKLYVLDSAHEELVYDETGNSFYLGYVLDFNGFRVYHSGDCVPYDGLALKLKELAVDSALLPVNGRDEYRKANGVPGNFTVKEAVALCRAAGIKRIVPHHFGMFDFNTEDPGNIEKILSKSGIEYILPELGRSFCLNKN